MRRLWLIFSQAATVGMALLFVVATLMAPMIVQLVASQRGVTALPNWALTPR